MFALITAMMLALCAACEELEPLPNAMPCPPLVYGEGEAMMSYGAIVARSPELVPGACVEIYFGRSRVAKGTVDGEHTFVLPFDAPGDLRGQSVEVRIASVDGSEGVQRYSVRMPAEAHSEIDYAADANPVIASAGGVEFTGRLVPVGRAWSISRVYAVNWSAGRIAPVAPTPRFAADFTAELPGQPGDRVSVLSVHAFLGQQGYGGCWCPSGDVCWAVCSDETSDHPRCRSGPPCRAGRGCTIIEVDERRRGPLRPELLRGPTARPDGGVDAGIARRDAGDSGPPS